MKSIITILQLWKLSLDEVKVLIKVTELEDDRTRIIIRSVLLSDHAFPKSLGISVIIALCSKNSTVCL